MPSISTKHRLARVLFRRAARGTAELETALVIPILMLLFLLVGAAVAIGRVRLKSVYDAENEAYHQVVTGNVTAALDPAPPDGFSVVRPALPTRYAEDQEATPVALNLLGKRSLVTIRDRAIFLDPSWHYGDADVERWFSDYVSESHPTIMYDAMGLQPPIPP